MAVSPALKAFLAAHRVKFKTHKHPIVYTAQEIAAAQHVPGAQLAKCVLVSANKGFWLAVLPATHLVDLPKLKRLLKLSKASLASEADIRRVFPDVEVGAMSPFGNLYQVPVLVDEALTRCSDIVCNAGTHTETLALRYKDFARVVKPRVGLFGVSATPPAKPAKRPAKPKATAASPAARAKRRGLSRRR